jgi:hypothetical protein
MRYKNIGTEDSPYWQLVGLESFCIYPRLLPLEIRERLPDPIQITEPHFTIEWPAGEITERALELGSKYVEFVKIELIKVKMGIVDNFGELTEAEEWASKATLKKLNAPGAAAGGV